MTHSIAQLETLATTPAESEFPYCPYTNETPGIVKYGPCFRVQSQEQADECLMKLVGYHLRFDDRKEWDENGAVFYRRLTWAEAVQSAREGIAFYALAHDVDPLYRVEGGEKIENCRWRDLAWKWYGARLSFGARYADIPAIRVVTEEDMLARVHNRREKSAKKRGEVYWRNVMKTEPPQEKLFEQ